MQDVLQGIGVVAIVLLILVGLVAGWLASIVAGHRGRYMALGVAGAVLAPIVLAALGVTVLAAGGLILLLVIAAAGALAVLLLARLLMR